MRFFAGGALLCLLFAAAFLWQRSWTASARAERDAAYARTRPGDGSDPPGGAGDVPDGWSRVIVGRPSGAARFAPTADDSAAPLPRDPAAEAGAAPRAASAAPATQREFQLVVQRGMSLSSICKQHYGSARREVVSALARANSLEDENALREGQRLVLPPIETLLGQKP